MHSADKATLRLTLGLGLAALIAYGMALTVPYAVCVMAVVLLSNRGRRCRWSRGSSPP